MKVRASVWFFGLIGSVVAHAGILAVLAIAIRPEPVIEQPIPTGELDVQAYQLDRTEAREQQLQSQQAKADTPQGAALDAGAIPQSKAKATPAPVERLRPDTARPPVAEEVRQAGDTLAPVTPAADFMPHATVATARLTALDQPQPRIAPTQVAPAILTQTTLPDIAPIAAVLRQDKPLPVAMPAVAMMPPIDPVSAVLPLALPAVSAVEPAQHNTAALPLADPEPSDLPTSALVLHAALTQRIDAPLTRPAKPDAQKLRAALAFSGADGDVDPVSIAAFQSFMQPGDITSSSGNQLRDGVAGLLAQVPCSRMQVAFDPDTATLRVNGHIPEDDLRAPVLAALQAQMGANIIVSDNILILPRPQCGALSGIVGVGLPQSTDQITNPLVIGEDAHARVFAFAKGDLLSLDMTAPDYDAFIYLDYFDADGTVLHLEPNEHAPLRAAKAQTVQQIGAKSMQDSGLKLLIGPPYGQEIAVAFAASEPLYAGLRPIQEPAAQYLEWLTAQVTKARTDHADFKGEWVYFFVSTAER